MEIIIDEKTGLEIAYIVNEDGTTISMLKRTYDEMIANRFDRVNVEGVNNDNS